MRKKTKTQNHPPANDPPTAATTTAPPPVSRPLYDQILFHDWCKACGICMAFCPVKIISADKLGKPVISEPDKCVGCRFCELHCPDFAITIKKRYPKRRKENGNS